MDETTLPVFWIFLLFPLFFIGVWLLVTAVLGIVSGWAVLGRRYGGTPTAEVWQSIGGASAVFQRWGVPANYNGIVTVSASSQGIGLSVMKLFGINSPPLLIPWEEITDAGSGMFLGLVYRFWFTTRDPRVTISVIGRAGRMLAEHWERARGGAAAAAEEAAIR